MSSLFFMIRLSAIFAKISKYLLPLVLCTWCAVLLAQKIDLPVADIGRHIKNGEVIVHSSWQDKWQILNANFYSYTEPEHPFVNHHWLSGVIFYLIHQLGGFKGLSVFYIALVTASFLLFYLIAQKRAGSAVASVLAVLVLPIIASRAEIRPEGFTYLFMGMFFWLLSSNGSNRAEIRPGGQIKRHRSKLFILPVLMLLWVNLHIGFIFGFVILGAFFLEELIKDIRLKIKDKSYRVFYYQSRLLFVVGVLCVITGLINPFFIKGLLYPLNIFREYGYLIVENQSVMFLQKLGMGTTLYFGLFKFLLGFVLASFIIRFILFVFMMKTGKRQMDSGSGAGMTKAQFPYHEFLLLGTAGVLAVLATRNFPVFGLLFLPIAAGNIKSILPEPKHPAYKVLPVLIASAVIIFGSFKFWENYEFKKSTFGIGLMTGAERAAEFFKANKIKGPIFNNYDIGGYLIYYLYHPHLASPFKGEEADRGEKVFTDNRPEAYSVEHFQKDYIPAQQDNVKWKELDSKYNFNVIFFSHRDLTPWGQAFLISKVSDSEWAPVFADQYNIIFVKKNLENVELIGKYLIPKENFSVVPN